MIRGMVVADINDYMTVSQAARALGRHERIVRRYIALGYLPAERVGKTYLIERRKISEFVPPLPGNPAFRRRKV